VGLRLQGVAESSVARGCAERTRPNSGWTVRPANRFLRPVRNAQWKREPVGVLEFDVDSVGLRGAEREARPATTWIIGKRSECC
jgi:hypothetical protein